MRSLPSTAEVVIIGGGIIGVSIAYYLAKEGAGNVLLLESGMLGQGATGECAGGIRTQFSTEINVQFSLVSLEVFKRFEEEFGVDPEFHRVGYLFLAVDEPQRAILKTTVRLIGRKGLEAELLGPGEIGCRWPFLRTHDLAGGSYTEHDGYAGPHEVLQGFAKGARRLGAMLMEGVEVTGIQVKKGRIQVVETALGERVATPMVINAAGPHASRVAAMVGLDLPVHPVRRQVFFTDAFNQIPSPIPMVIDLEHG